MDKDSSEALLRRSLDGDGAALGALVQRHYPSVRAFVRLRMSPLLRAHESADDLVQSTCGELLRRAEGFDWRGEEAFRAWLFTAALRKMRSRERRIRAHKRDVRRHVHLESVDEHAALPTRRQGPVEALLDEERLRRLEQAFDVLPEHYREVITLSRYARLGRAEIARVMDRSEDAVRNLLPRALAALARTLVRLEQGGAAGLRARGATGR